MATKGQIDLLIKVNPSINTKLKGLNKLTEKFKKNTLLSNKGYDKLNKTLFKTNRSIQALTVETRNLQRAQSKAWNTRPVEKYGRAIDRVKAKTKSSRGGGLGSLLGGIPIPGLGPALGVAAIGSAVYGIGRKSIGAAMNREKQMRDIASTQGKENAKVWMSEFDKYAKDTSFRLDDAYGLMQDIEGGGGSVADLRTRLKILEAGSKGDAAKAKQFIDKFNRIQGRAGQRLIEGDESFALKRGFSILGEISKATGEDMKSLSKQLKAGKLTLNDFWNATEKNIQSGASLDKQLSEVRKSSIGALTKAQNQLTSALETLGKSALPAFIDAVRFATSSITFYNKIMGNVDMNNPVIKKLHKVANDPELIGDDKATFKKAVRIVNEGFKSGDTKWLYDMAEEDLKAKIPGRKWSSDEIAKQANLTLMRFLKQELRVPKYDPTKKVTPGDTVTGAGTGIGSEDNGLSMITGGGSKIKNVTINIDNVTGVNDLSIDGVEDMKQFQDALMLALFKAIGFTGEMIEN